MDRLELRVRPEFKPRRLTMAVSEKSPRAWQRMLSGRRLDLLDPSPLANALYVGVGSDNAYQLRATYTLPPDFGAINTSYLAITGVGAYDAAVSAWMAGHAGETAPRRRAFAGTLAQTLRYGENPHQRAAFYTTGSNRPGVATAKQLQGKELSCFARAWRRRSSSRARS